MQIKTQNKIFPSVLAFLLLTTIYLLPFFSHAQPAVSTLIPCGEIGKDGKLNECKFDDLMKLFANVIDYIIKYLVIPGATISFAFVGWKLLTSGTNPGARSEAKKSAIKVAIGLAVILAAWLIVRTVLKVFLTDAVIDKLPLQL